MIKTTIAEFKKFITDDTFWNPDDYWDEGSFIVGGEEVDSMDFNPDDFSPETSVQFEGGIVASGKLPSDEEYHDEIDLEKFFKRWKKKQETTVLVFEVDNDKIDEVKKVIASYGGKIMK